MQRQSRRDLYRLSKRRLVSLLAQRWNGSRVRLERAIRNFLRHKRRGYLLRLLQNQTAALSAAGAILIGGAAWANPPILLSDIAAGTGGFFIDTTDTLGSAGRAVSGAGDINGDGLDDVLIGAPYANVSGYNVGKVYVVFGKEDTDAVDLDLIDAGTGNGWVISGAPNNEDRNIGDQIDGNARINNGTRPDIVLGSHSTFGNFDQRAYVIFGRAGKLPVSIADVEAGTEDGFAITGIASPSYGKAAATAVADFNGDGRDDIMIGAPSESPGESGYAGRAYVAFGKGSTTPLTSGDITNSASPRSGLLVNGALNYDYAGRRVSSVGDMNGDGLGELLITAPGASLVDAPDGAVYVVFGKTSEGNVDLDNLGNRGFAIGGFAVDPFGNIPVAGCGDVNGDGRADVLIGEPQYDGGYSTNTGGAYVVFGKSDSNLVDLVDLRNGSGGGFHIIGRTQPDYDNAGASVDGIGDINGDGLDDIAIGAPNNLSTAGGEEGNVFVVFGRDATAPVLLADVEDGVGGFIIRGITPYDDFGSAVAGAGDVNGDGVPDIVVGRETSDEAYVVFGPAQAPVEVGLTNVNNDKPITSGVVFVERLDAPIGFRAPLTERTGGGGIYTSPLTDIGDYLVVATAAKFLPSAETVVSTSDGETVPGIQLTPDPGLASPSFLEVTIRVRDGDGLPTGQVLVTKNIQLRQDAIDIGLTAYYGQGTMNFVGVPPGEYEVFIPDTTSFAFTPINVTIATGVFEEIVMDATLVDADPAGPIARAPGSLPGLVVGSVLNGDAVPLDGYPNALVIHTLTADAISTFATATGDGSYVMPDIIAGAGTVQAFTPDGAIAGTTKGVNVVSGQIYGDESNEDTLLAISPLEADRDSDGLPDSFEDQFFDVSIPESLRGPDDDPDGEGLSNFEEFAGGTDPTNPDTDNDAVLDGVELIRGSDPNDPLSMPGDLNEAYVDLGFSDPLQVGNVLNPFNQLQDAADAVKTGGEILIKGDVEITTGGAGNGVTINRPMTIKAFRGPIRIE